MSEKRLFVLAHDQARRNAAAWIMQAPAGYVVKVTEPTRSLDQNAALWPLLEEISKQVPWYGQKLTEEEWKDVFSASLKQQKVVPGLEGGFVVCGQRTSKMKKKEFSDLLELANAFAAQHNVKLNEEVSA